MHLEVSIILLNEKFSESKLRFLGNLFISKYNSIHIFLNGEKLVYRNLNKIIYKFKFDNILNHYILEETYSE